MRYPRPIRKNNQRGSAVLEFVLTAPLLFLLMLGSADFGRAFYYSVTISNAAGAGALQGGQSLATSGHSDLSVQAARADASDVGTVSATAVRFCACPNGNKVDCLLGTCGSDAPRVYVSCRVEKSFDTLVNWPAIPELFVVRREAFMRVQ